MTRETDSPWYTKAEAAQYLRVGVATLERWEKDGTLKITRKVRGIQSRRYHRADLDDVIVIKGETDD